MRDSGHVLSTNFMWTWEESAMHEAKGQGSYIGVYLGGLNLNMNSWPDPRPGRLGSNN